eukprot:m.219304 g.219304  ORF g.219304 m.219304 type:complete len:195 (-) comp30420_c0_seq1:260-844(-)
MPTASAAEDKKKRRRERLAARAGQSCDMATSATAPAPAEPVPEPELAPAPAEAVPKGVERIEIEVPAYAAGLVIGKGRANIKTLREIEGVRSCNLKSTLNATQPGFLIATGTSAALQHVEANVRQLVDTATRSMENGSRRDHTGNMRPNGTLFRPHDVHKAVRKPSKPHSREAWKKEDKKKMHERNRRDEARRA